MRYISKEKIYTVIKQVGRFDKNYSHFYDFRVLSLCLKNRRGSIYLDKKSFLTYLNFYKNEKVLSIEKTRNDIYLVFFNTLRKLCLKLEKAIHKMFFDFLIFKSQKKVIFLNQIRKIKMLLKKLNRKDFNSNKFFFKKIIRELFSSIILFFEKDEILYKIYGQCISKIYMKIVSKIKKRQSLRFFFNSLLAISVNTNLFRGVFNLNSYYLQNNLLELIYERLYLSPLKLNVFSS